MTRVRRMKWGGLALTVLCLTVSISSRWWYAWYLSRGGTWVGVSGGAVGIRYTDPSILPDPPHWLYGVLDPSASLSWWFDWGSQPGPQWWFMAPLWVLAVPTLLVTVVAWWLDGVGRRRARAGHCSKCGYSLRGLREGGVCPECGSTPSRTAGAADASAEARLWRWALRPRPRARKAVRWGGAGASLLILAVFIGSAWWRVGYVGEGGISVSVSRGLLCIEYWPPGHQTGWLASRHAPGLVWRLNRGDASSAWWFQVPLWVAAAPLLLAAGAGWWLEAIARRRGRSVVK